MGAFLDRLLAVCEPESRVISARQGKNTDGTLMGVVGVRELRVRKNNPRKGIKKGGRSHLSIWILSSSSFSASSLMEPVSPLPPFRCRIKLDGYHDYAVTLLVGFTLGPLFRFEISLYCEQFTLLDSVK